MDINDDWLFPPSPKSVGLLLTYTCTAACKNCCFECTPKRRETLPISLCLCAIDELSEIGTVESITLSGGECFLRYDDILQIVRRVRENGMQVKCVTNAYWAINLKVALKKLRPLVQVGLNVIEVSTDDYHIEYVPMTRVANALEAAYILGIETHLTVIYDRQTRRLNEILRKLDLSYKPTVVSEFPVLNVGFAKDRINEECLITQDTLPSRSCAEVIRRPSITPHGELFACCAVAGFTSPLKMGVVNSIKLSKLFEQARSEALYIILAFDGPIKLAAIAAEHGVFDLEQTFVDECHLCHTLLSDEKVVSVVLEELKKDRLFYLLRRDYVETLMKPKKLSHSLNKKLNVRYSLRKGGINDEARS